LIAQSRFAVGAEGLGTFAQRRLAVVAREQLQRLEPVQGYLAHQKQPPPPRTAIGLQAYSYCRVLGGGVFLSARYPCGRPNEVATKYRS